MDGRGPVLPQLALGETVVHDERETETERQRDFKASIEKSAN